MPYIKHCPRHTHHSRAEVRQGDGAPVSGWHGRHAFTQSLGTDITLCRLRIGVGRSLLMGQRVEENSCAGQSRGSGSDCQVGNGGEAAER
jgi:hypothetical protein